MNRLRKAIALLLVTLPVLAAPTLARADDATELERGRNSYDAGRYDEGIERFRTMLDPARPNALQEPAIVERARGYYVACLIATGRLDEADRVIEQIIRQNPLFLPDPVIFPGKVVDRFTDAKARLRPEIEAASRLKAEADRVVREKAEQARKAQAAYIAELSRLASHEVVIERHSRAIAAIPFGVGQFQNGQDGLGWAFLATETVSAAIAIGAVVLAERNVVKFASGDKTVDQGTLNENLATGKSVFIPAAASLVALAIGGIVHAELTFVPEVKEERERPIPKPPVLTPTAAVGPGGGTVGVVGTF